jgi:hypothetical protein
MEGATGDDNSIPTFTGKLVNPHHAEEFDWANEKSKSDAFGFDVSNATPEFFHDDAWLMGEITKQAGSAGPISAAAKLAKGFLDLPIEIRREIYDLACGE